MKKIFIVFLILTLISSFIISKNFETTYSLHNSFKESESSPKKFMPIDDLLVSTLGGTAGMLGGALLGGIIGNTFDSGWATLGYIIFGIAAGAPIGSVSALNIYGNILEKNGNFWGSVVGTSLGTALSYVLISTFNLEVENYWL